MVKGLNVQSCVSCGAYTLDQLTLERLLGGPTSHWGTTPEPSPYVQTPNPRGYHGAPTIPAPPPPPPALPGELPPELPSQQVPTYKPTPLPPLRQGLASPPSNPPPAVQPPSPAPAPTNDTGRTLMVVGLALIAVLLLIFMGGAGVVIYQGVNTQPPSLPPDTVPNTDLNEVLAEDDEKTPEAAPDPAPQVTAEPPQEPEPEPDPAPKVDPVRRLVNQGWGLVESNPDSAAAAFRKGIDIRPGDAGANYGYGYVLANKQGNTAGAKPYLCKALSGSDIEVRREVNSLLKQHQLTCP